MSLVRRKRRKQIRITRAAKLIGCSSESIRTGAIGKFELFKLNPDSERSPWMMFEAELEAFLDRREQRA